MDLVWFILSYFQTKIKYQSPKDNHIETPFYSRKANVSQFRSFDISQISQIVKIKKHKNSPQPGSQVN